MGAISWKALFKYGGELGLLFFTLATHIQIQTICLGPSKSIHY